MIERQAQRLSACQLAPPILEIGVHGAAAQSFPLRFREVRILDGQFRQTRSGALHERAVKVAELFEQDAEGPAIEGDVVNGENQDMALIG